MKMEVEMRGSANARGTIYRQDQLTNCPNTGRVDFFRCSHPQRVRYRVTVAGAFYTRHPMGDTSSIFPRIFLVKSNN